MINIKVIRKISVAALIGIMCGAFICGSAAAADAGNGSAGSAEELIDWLKTQLADTDTDNPEETDARIRQLAEQYGYDISDEDADTIRQVLDDAGRFGMGAEEMEGMYDAFSEAGGIVQETNDFLGAVKSFFVNIFNVIRNWFMGLFNWK